MLREKRLAPATALSGGQQQMATIGPRLDVEPALAALRRDFPLGLAPIVIRDLYAALPRIKQGGVSLFIVEQDIAQAMRSPTASIAFQEGRVTLTGAPSQLSRDAIHEAYFGH